MSITAHSVQQRVERPQSRDVLHILIPSVGRVCPHMLRAVQYVLLKANTLPDVQHWLGIRISYGMNGVVMRSEDIPLLITTLRENVTRKPPDLIWQAWAAGKHRPPVCARGNVRFSCLPAVPAEPAGQAVHAGGTHDGGGCM